MASGSAPVLSRRRAVGATAAAAAVAAGGAQAKERRNPILGHHVATIGVPDVAAAQKMYERAIGVYEVNKGTVSEGVARAWGAPKMVGRPWVMMRCASGDETFRLRIIEVDPVPGYKAMGTWGLNSIEMISSDIYDVNERVLAAGFTVIGEPRPLSEAYASVHAMQMKGPGEEVFYFAGDVTGDNEFGLIEPKSLVDRPFNAVIGTQNMAASRAYYGNVLGMSLGTPQKFRVRVVADALGYSRDIAIEMAGARGTRPGSSLEFDAYDVALSGPRPRANGQLPPGVSMVSLATDDFEAIAASYISEPAALYGRGRTAAFVGPSGEWVEIVEVA
jgi:catechol 2,3-dioxygenase-like lactoylglutathione lyase family enzyme